MEINIKGDNIWNKLYWQIIEIQEIKASVNLFLADRKNSNSLLKILGHLDVTEPGKQD